MTLGLKLDLLRGGISIIRIAICDDCPTQTEVLAAQLDKYRTERPGIDISPSYYASGDELLNELDSGRVFDLYLLDILMPGISGIELAEIIRKKNEDVALVFLTSSKDYALEAFNVSAAQYILKPVMERTLFPVLDRLIPLINQKMESYYILSMPERTVKIPFSSIVCIELVGRRLKAYLENKNILYSKYIREPFNTIVAPLLQDKRFLHTHKSFILNLAHAEALASDSFIMKGDVIVPIPRYKHNEAREKYLSYVSEISRL